MTSHSPAASSEGAAHQVGGSGAVRPELSDAASELFGRRGVGDLAEAKLAEGGPSAVRRREDLVLQQPA